MCRQKRVLSSYMIYHCVWKCCHDVAQFADKQGKDMIRAAFDKSFNDKKFKDKVKCLSYCIMSNHVHIVLQGDIDIIGRLFKSVGARYANWYRYYNGSCGPLFNGRYFSQPIESDCQLRNTLAYVLNNPIELPHVKSALDYEYSNFRSLRLDDKVSGDFACNTLRRDYINDDELIAMVLERGEELRRLNLEIPERKWLNDDALFEKLCEITGSKRTARKVALKSPTELSSILRKLLNAGGSLRCISRVTGVSVGRVRRLLA